MNDKKPLVLTLMGPTASGKTDLALYLAERFPIALVSVDSSLVYRELNIGAAKPDSELLRIYPHRLMNIRNVDEPYSASDFRHDAMAAIDEIHQQGKIPLLVGGTMLYFKVLMSGIAELPSANADIRQRLLAEARQKGWPALHERLQQADPESARRIHPNDSQRLQRALEVFEVSGKTLTELQAGEGFWKGQQKLPFHLVSMALMTDNRKLLHQRIESRFKKMLEQGLLDEVRLLKQRFPDQASLPAMKAVGYRQVWQFLDGELDERQMLQKAVAATRQLAKRQITWLRSWPELQCFDMEAVDLFATVTAFVDEQMSNY